MFGPEREIMNEVDTDLPPKDIVIVGSGGFGREVADVIRAINAASATPTWNLLGYLDDTPSDVNRERARRQGLGILGPVDPKTLSGTPYFVVGINNGVVRRNLADKLEEAGWKPATLVHPSAGVGSDCRIGEGSILCAGVQITTNVDLGRHIHLNLNCTIGHDSRLEDFVSVNPLAAISGEITLGECVTVGSSSFILQGLTLAPGTIVGASACVVKSTDGAVTLVGVPAKGRSTP